MKQEFTVKQTRLGVLVVRVRKDTKAESNPNAWRNAGEGELPEIMRRLSNHDKS